MSLPYPVYFAGRPAGAPYSYPSYFHPPPIAPPFPRPPIAVPPPPAPFIPFIGPNTIYIPPRGGPYVF